MADFEKHDGFLFGDGIAGLLRSRTELAQGVFHDVMPEVAARDKSLDDADNAVMRRCGEIMRYVERWIDSTKNNRASGYTVLRACWLLHTAFGMQRCFYMVSFESDKNGEVPINPSLAENLSRLGEEFAEFKTIVEGGERQAKSGKATDDNLSQNRQGKPMPVEAAEQFRQGIAYRKVAERFNVSRRTAERWR